MEDHINDQPRDSKRGIIFMIWNRTGLNNPFKGVGSKSDKVFLQEKFEERLKDRMVKRDHSSLSLKTSGTTILI